MLKSVDDNYTPLLHWRLENNAVFDEAERRERIYSIIDDKDFWSSVRRLAIVLEPLHTAQKASESGHSHPGDTLQRWLRLRKHLLDSSVNWPPLKPLFELKTKGLDGAKCTVFGERMDKQVKDQQWAAYVLHPKYVDVAPELGQQRHCIEWLKTQIPEQDWKLKALSHFHAFRQRKGAFNSQSDS